MYHAAQPWRRWIATILLVPTFLTSAPPAWAMPRLREQLVPKSVHNSQKALGELREELTPDSSDSAKPQDLSGPKVVFGTGAPTDTASGAPITGAELGIGATAEPDAVHRLGLENAVRAWQDVSALAVAGEAAGTVGFVRPPASFNPADLQDMGRDMPDDGLSIFGSPTSVDGQTAAPGGASWFAVKVDGIDQRSHIRAIVWEYIADGDRAKAAKALLRQLYSEQAAVDRILSETDAVIAQYPNEAAAWRAAHAQAQGSASAPALASHVEGEVLAAGDVDALAEEAEGDVSPARRTPRGSSGGGGPTFSGWGGAGSIIPDVPPTVGGPPSGPPSGGVSPQRQALEGRVRERLANGLVSDPSAVEVNITDGLATVTINRPDELNALNQDVMTLLYRYMGWLEDDPSVKAIIVTGAGRAFVAGADIKNGLLPGRLNAEELSATGQVVFRRVAESKKPVIAAINGFALGGGYELALAAHYRIATETALVGQPEVGTLGIMPGYAGTQRLARLLNPRAAALITLSGEQIEASRALAYGMVDEVASDVLDAAKRMAQRLIGAEVSLEELDARRRERTSRLQALKPGQSLADDPAVKWLLAVNRDRYQQYGAELAIQAIEKGIQLDERSGDELEAKLFARVMISHQALQGLKGFTEGRRRRPLTMPALLPPRSLPGFVVPEQQRAWVLRRDGPRGRPTDPGVYTLMDDFLTPLVTDTGVLMGSEVTSAEANFVEWLSSGEPVDIPKLHGQRLHVPGNNPVGPIIAVGALVPESLEHIQPGKLAVVNNAATNNPLGARVILGDPHRKFVYGYDAFGVRSDEPLRGGALMDFTTMDPWQVMPYPEGRTVAEAAVPMLSFPTNFHNARRTQPKPGDTVLIVGYLGGTGQSAAEILEKIFMVDPVTGQPRGRHIALVSSAEKAQEAARRSKGDLQVIPLNRKDFDLEAADPERRRAEGKRFIEKLIELNGGQPINGAIDYMGGPYTELLLSALADDGWYTAYGAGITPHVEIIGQAGSATPTDMFARIDGRRTLPLTEQVAAMTPRVYGDTPQARQAMQRALATMPHERAIARVLTYGADEQTLEVIREARRRNVPIVVVVRNEQEETWLRSHLQLGMPDGMQLSRILPVVQLEALLPALEQEQVERAKAKAREHGLRLTAAEEAQLHAWVKSLASIENLFNMELDSGVLKAAVRKAFGGRNDPDLIIERADPARVLGLAPETQTLEMSHFRLLRSDGGGQVAFLEDTSGRRYRLNLLEWPRQGDVEFAGGKHIVLTHYAGPNEARYVQELVNNGTLTVQDQALVPFEQMREGLERQGRETRKIVIPNHVTGQERTFEEVMASRLAWSFARERKQTQDKETLDLLDAELLAMIVQPQERPAVTAVFDRVRRRFTEAGLDWENAAHRQLVSRAIDVRTALPGRARRLAGGWLDWLATPARTDAEREALMRQMRVLADPKSSLEPLKEPFTQAIEAAQVTLADPMHRHVLAAVMNEALAEADRLVRVGTARRPFAPAEPAIADRAAVQALAQLMEDHEHPRAFLDEEQALRGSPGWLILWQEALELVRLRIWARTGQWLTLDEVAQISAAKLVVHAKNAAAAHLSEVLDRLNTSGGQATDVTPAWVTVVTGSPAEALGQAEALTGAPVVHATGPTEWTKELAKGPAIEDFVTSVGYTSRKGEESLSTALKVAGQIFPDFKDPAGKSTGKGEATKEKKGALAQKFMVWVARAIKSLGIHQQEEIDRWLIAHQAERDEEYKAFQAQAEQGTDMPADAKLPGNVTLGASLAVAKASAVVKGMTLTERLRELRPALARTFGRVSFAFNIYNGGEHALKGDETREALGKTRISLQEIMVTASSRLTYRQQLALGDAVKRELGKLLAEPERVEGFDPTLKESIGDEGGFSVKGIGDDDYAIELVDEAARRAGYVAGVDYFLSLDIAAGSLLKETRDGVVIYNFKGREHTSAQMVDWAIELKRRTPHLVSIEDLLDEDDIAGWAEATTRLGNDADLTDQELQDLATLYASGKLNDRVLLIGDDVFVTQAKRLTELGFARDAATGILIKLNQNGTLTGTLDVMEAAVKGYQVTVTVSKPGPRIQAELQAEQKLRRYINMVSHRSGETPDTTLAHLAHALQVIMVKTGAPSQGPEIPEDEVAGQQDPRRAKYLELIALEEGRNQPAPRPFLLAAYDPVPAPTPVVPVLDAPRLSGPELLSEQAEAMGVITKMDEGPEVENAMYAIGTHPPSTQNTVAAASWAEVLRRFHGANVNDQFIPPLVEVDDNGRPVGVVRDGDTVMYWDFRTDRAKPLTAAFIGVPYEGQVGGLSDEAGVRPHVTMVTMTHYDDNFTAETLSPEQRVQEAFNPSEPINDTYSEVIAREGIDQLVVGETEKWRAITWFLNGRKNLGFQERSYQSNVRTLQHPTLPITVKVVDSREVTAHTKAPQMRAKEITDILLEGVQAGVKDIFNNYANADMVAHASHRPEDFEAVVEAILELDAQLGRLVPAALTQGYTVLITADHGNAEEMFFPDGQSNPAHAPNPVPFIVLGLEGHEALSIRPDVSIGNVAPTLAQLRGLTPPASWDRQSALVGPVQGRKDRKILRIALDGYGLRAETFGNAMAEAARRKGSPLHVDRWMQGEDSAVAAPASASGEENGYPAGTAGTTEFGHVLFDAGRRVGTDQVAIDLAIEKGEFKRNPVLLEAMRRVKASGKKLHLMGILSDGRVHSSLNHVEPTLETAAQEGLAKDQVAIHVITDGRDVAGESAGQYLTWLEQRIAQYGVGRIVSIWGRGWGKDRANRWKRIETAYRSLTEGTAAVHVRLVQTVEELQVIPDALDGKTVAQALDDLDFKHITGWGDMEPKPAGDYIPILIGTDGVGTFNVSMDTRVKAGEKLTLVHRGAMPATESRPPEANAASGVPSDAERAKRVEGESRETPEPRATVVSYRPSAGVLAVVAKTLAQGKAQPPEALLQQHDIDMDPDTSILMPRARPISSTAAELVRKYEEGVGEL